MLEIGSEVKPRPILPEFSFYPRVLEDDYLAQLSLLTGLSVGLANKIKRYRRDPFLGNRFDLGAFDPASIRDLYTATDEQLLKVTGMGQTGVKQVRSAILEFHQKYFELPA